ncbi:MAG: NnrS family protein [Propylenella sp.]
MTTASDTTRGRPQPLPGDRSVPRSRVNAGDVEIDRRGRSRRAPAFLSYGFRPFFLLGAIYASLAVPLWLWTYFGGAAPLGPSGGVAWHAHEMLFGYLGAVMAGFILTAVPNWTGRLPLSGAPLAGLVTLWLIGRVAMFLHPEPLSTAALDLAFPLALAAAVWREIVAGRNLRNAPVALLLTLFAFANLLDHAGGFSASLEGYGIRLGLGVAALLIALVGGRVTPSFTRNWMARLQLAPLPAAMDHLDRIALGVTAIAVIGWVIAPDASAVATGLLAAGIFLFARLARWHGHRAVEEPIVLVLHLGYLWLATALFLLGAAGLLPSLVPATSAVHALTAGAVGTMTLAIMTRASRGHTGRALTADGATVSIYILVTLGAVLRVLAPFMGDLYAPVLVLGGIVWSAAFALFAISYAPMLIGRPAT